MRVLLKLHGKGKENQDIASAQRFVQSRLDRKPGGWRSTNQAEDFARSSVSQCLWERPTVRLIVRLGRFVEAHKCDCADCFVDWPIHHSECEFFEQHGPRQTQV